MTSALLADGRIIELVQDCACTSHAGPHWLYEDEQQRQINHELALQWIRSGRFADYYAASQAEATRLKTKATNMTRCGIERLLPEAQDQTE